MAQAKRVRGSHWWFTDLVVFLLCLCVVMLSFTLSPGDELVSLWGLEVPKLCAFQNLFGIDCLGCGMTRSFVYLAHGDLETALRKNLLGPVLFMVVLSQLPYRLIRLGRSARERARARMQAAES